MKIRKVGGNEAGGYIHHCPGCKHNHVIYTRNAPGKPVWSFDGNEEKPTFNPSVRVFEIEKGKNATLCHYFLRNGQIQFLNDCAHSLAGQTVDLPDVDEDD